MEGSPGRTSQALRWSLHPTTGSDRRVLGFPAVQQEIPPAALNDRSPPATPPGQPQNGCSSTEGARSSVRQSIVLERCAPILPSFTAAPLLRNGLGRRNRQRACRAPAPPGLQFADGSVALPST